MLNVVSCIAGNTVSTNEVSAAASDAKYAQQAMKLLTSYLAACNEIALDLAATAQHCDDSRAALRPAKAAPEARTSLGHHTQSSIVTDSPDDTANRLSTPSMSHATNRSIKTPSRSLSSTHTTAKDNAAAMDPNMQMDIKAEASVAAVPHPLKTKRKVPHEVQSDVASDSDTGRQPVGVAQCTAMWAEVCEYHVPTVGVTHLHIIAA